MKPILIYCYDAYCGWCYGFSKVITSIQQQYQHQLDFEVLSGGMIPNESPAHIGRMAGYLVNAYTDVENLAGVKFGEDWLWHVRNPEESDWFPHSEKAAVAMCIFKEIHPEQQVQFAAALQYSLYYEGRDLTDDEAYRHLLESFKIDDKIFYERLHSEAYFDKAKYEFALCKQLNVSGFPTAFIQVSDKKLYMIARGYMPLDAVTENIEKVLESLQQPTTNH